MTPAGEVVVSEIHRILFEPTTIGSIHVKNRYAMGPMGPLAVSYTHLTLPTT